MAKLFGSLLQIACRKILLKGNLFFIEICRTICFILTKKNYIYVIYRPTATELLKHPIFKKAKDKKYLQSTLIAIGPSLETRVQKVVLYLFKK